MLTAAICFILLIIGMMITRKNWAIPLKVLGAFIVVTIIILAIDNFAQTADYEVYSGKVVDWEHEEEYDVYHPSVCTTVNNVTSCSAAWTEHVDASNAIKTTDDGWITVGRTPDGSRRFNDSWPNDTGPLKELWPAGSPTASVHHFTNKVKASSSLYRVKEIDLKKYPDLPEYPIEVKDDLTVDRLLGDVPNKIESTKELNVRNTFLNEMKPDPEKPGKMKPWKQVNMIFVNVGANKSPDYGYALQNKWGNGRKNDFIVSFSMNPDGKLNWVYVFSWSEVESLKKDVRDTLMNMQPIGDFKPIVRVVSDMVEKDFVRKQFKDFDYIQVNPSTTAQIFISVFALIALIIHIILSFHYSDRAFIRRMYGH